MCSDKFVKKGKETPLKRSFKAQVPRIYMYRYIFRYEELELNVRSIVQPEVEVMVFQRMRSDKITKNGENALKMQFEGLISACIYLSKRGIRTWGPFWNQK